MPRPRVLLWIDVEASGLLTDPIVPTILEAAWMLTDPAGVQLSPLRQRFTALPAAENRTRLESWRDVRPTGRWTWESRPGGEASDYPIEPVRAMHAGNGLTIEHAAHPLVYVLDDWSVLDDFLHADLSDVGAPDMDSGQVLLAGGGVSHYEDRFLRYCAPRTFGLRSMHYSTGADVSTVLRTLSTRLLDHAETGCYPDVGKADQVLAVARDEDDERRLPAEWGRIELADRGAGGWDQSDRDVTEWRLAEEDTHRAASGIARALMAYRLLPYAVLDVVGGGYADALDLAAARAGIAQG